ncbi:MAG: ComEA family DNA-binding protein [Bacilli bacterium]|nr:ComEA family DNA-binding protein [Bacilli bacterium]
MNKRNIIIGILVIALIVLGIVFNNGKTVDSQDNESQDIPRSLNMQIAVDIKGEVKKPGLYYLDSNSRVLDAINVAGGLTKDADIEKINLATLLEDGMIVNVFKKAGNSKIEKISINTASIDELTKLTGIGESKAKNIIDYRNKHGYFMSLEELCNVDGITEKIYSDNKEFICL